jgi:hypothetical protein
MSRGSAKFKIGEHVFWAPKNKYGTVRHTRSFMDPIEYILDMDDFSKEHFVREYELLPSWKTRDDKLKSIGI